MSRRPKNLTFEMTVAYSHPHLTAQWHPDNDQRPDQVMTGAGYRAHWVCHNVITVAGVNHECAHEWVTRVCLRTTPKLTTGCPACAGWAASWWNTVQTQAPRLIREWHPDNDRTPGQVTAGSGYKARWVCANTRTHPDGTTFTCAHEWVATADKRARGGRGCPACAGNAPSWWNNLKYAYPHLATQWHPSNALGPDQVAPHSNTRAQWQCHKIVTVNGVDRECAHEWSASPGTRVKGNGCPACAGYAATDWNNLTVTHPHLTPEWDPRNTFRPEEVTRGTHRKALWLCNATVGNTDVVCGYEWEASIDNRARGKGCPACSGNVITDRNRLSLAYPHLVAEWHPDNELTPDQVSFGSDVRAHWRCGNVVNVPEGARVCGFVWDAKINNRAVGKTDCPACAGLAVSDWNSLGSLHPALITEWHPKNLTTIFDTVAGVMTSRYWWHCARMVTVNGMQSLCGHEWKATPHSRANGGTCPACALVATSKEEIYLYFELAQFVDALHGGRRVRVGNRNWGADILLPDHNIAIEYDGSYWHANHESRDLIKTAALKAAGWTVLRIREEPLPLLGGHEVTSKPWTYKQTANTVLSYLRDTLNVPVPNLDEYLALPDLVTKDAADAHIEQLRANRDSRKHDRNPFVAPQAA